MLIDSKKAMTPPPPKGLPGPLKERKGLGTRQVLKKKKKPICNMAFSTVPGWLTGLLEIAGSDFVKGKKM